MYVCMYVCTVLYCNIKEHTLDGTGGVDGSELGRLAGVAHHLLVVEQAVILLAARVATHTSVVVCATVSKGNSVVALFALVAVRAGACGKTLFGETFSCPTGSVKLSVT